MQDDSRGRSWLKRLTKIFSIVTGVSLGSSVVLVGLVLLTVTLIVRTEMFQSALKNRVVEIVRHELETEVSYQSASVDVFSLKPSISFEQIVFKPLNTELKTELKRFELGISVFSLPLLGLNQLVLSHAVIDGLNYRITDVDALERWLDSLRPKDTIVPLRFQTSVETIALIDAQFDVAVKRGGKVPFDVDGSFAIETFQVGLDSESTKLSGLATYNSLKFAGLGPYEGQIILDRANLRDGNLNFKNFKITSDADFLEFSGKVSDLANPSLEVKGATHLRIESLFPDLALKGTLQSSFQLAGPWQKMSGEGKLIVSSLSWQKKSFEVVESNWRLDRDSIVLRNLTAASGDEVISGQIAIPFSSEPNLKLDLNFENSDVRHYVSSLHESLPNWRGKAFGSLRFDGAFGGAIKGKLSLDARVEELDIRTRQSNRSIFYTPMLKITASGDVDSNSLSQFGFQLDLGTGKWNGSAKINPQRLDMSWNANLDGKKIGRLFDYNLAVKGDLPGSLSGEWGKIELLVKPKLEIFQLNQQMARNLKGNLRFVNERLLADPLVADELQMSGGIYFPKGNKDYFQNFKFSISGIDLREFFGYLKFTPEEIWNAKGVLSGDGFFAGDLDRPRGSGRVFVEKWGFGERLARGYRASAQWAWSKDVFYLTDCLFLLGAKEGGVSGDFTIDSRGFSDVSFTGEKLRVADWFYLAGIDLNFQSAGKFNLSYQRDVPSLVATLESSDTSAEGIRGQSRFSFNWSRDQLSGELKLFDSSLSASLSSSVSAGIQKSEFNLQMLDFNASPWIRFLAASRLSTFVRGSGKLRGEAKLQKGQSLLGGFLSQIPKMSGELDVNSIRVNRSALVLQQAEAFRIRLNPGASSWLRLEADRINVVSSDGHRLKMGGFYESPKDFELKVSGRTDLRAVSGLSPTLSRSEGVIEAEGALRPVGFSGRLSLTKGLVTFQDSPLVVRNVEAELKANQSDFEIQRLSGSLREGGVQARGRIKLTADGLESARVTVELTQTLFQPQDGFSFRASGPLELRVSREGGDITGRLQIFDGLFRRRVDLRSDLVGMFKSRKVDFRTSEYQNMPWRNWRLKVNIDSSDPFNVRNNLAEGAANLRLLVGGTVSELRLTGSIDVVRGQFAFNNRQFLIRSGSIVFQSPTTNIPNYDIRAETEIGEYRIFVKLFGSPDEQKISYSSDPVLSEKDILSVISFGLPSSSEELKSQDPRRAYGLTGISFVTGQIQDQIEGRLSRDFGVQRFSLGPAFFEETGRTELQLMVGADIIKNRVGVNYSQFLSADGGQKVELDLRMTRNFSLIGSWREVREEGKSTDDFGGDFRFRFEVE